LLGEHEAEYDTTLPCTSGATRPVNIGFVIVRRVEMNHHGDIVHVNSTSRYIAGNQRLHLAFGELCERAHALVLATAAMNGSGFDTSSLKVLGQSVGPVPRAAEDDSRPACVDCFRYHLVPVASVNLPENVGCRSDVGGFLTNFVADGVFLIVPSKLGDIAVERCGVQHGLALFGGLVKQSTNGRHESHVRHAVSLVDHDEIHISEVHSLLSYEVFQAPWACDQDVYTLT
jgi:hypothetical protein